MTDTLIQGAPASWTPTRAAGLARLAAFLPRAGRAYARDRNVDRGPADRANVSALSPWIRRRLITEEEVLRAVLDRHGPQDAAMFIQEVFWRTYWKGWLERRADIFARYEADRLALLSDVSADEDLRARLSAASEGRTGIGCFDEWVGELLRYGWLHNHARMWFASIWIFTLRLPWQLGAGFMFSHLLDADPASNTLSWRWVAGLHTRGKHYLARADNIALNTLGRFHPAGQLDERALPLSETISGAPAVRLPPAKGPEERQLALLLHEEDLHTESLGLTADVIAIAGLRLPHSVEACAPCSRFADGALEDGLMRAGEHYSAPAQALAPGMIVSWARACGVREVVTAYAPIGRTASTLAEIRDELALVGIRLAEVRRPFDERAWPHADAGFFRFRERIPELLAAVR